MFSKEQIIINRHFTLTSLNLSMFHKICDSNNLIINIFDR